MDNDASFAGAVAGAITAVQLWILKNRRALANENWWSRFMQAGRSSPIVFEKRPGSAGGSRVNLRTEGTLGGIGKMGDNRFAVAGDFGKIPLGEMAIHLDLIKQATGVTPHAEEMLGLGTQIRDGIPDQIGAWGGRYIARHIDQTLLHTSAATSRMVVNNKQVAALLTADTIGWNTIMQQAMVMSDAGGRPFRKGKQENGEEMWNMMFPLTSNQAFALKSDTLYKERLVGNAVRGSDSPFFTGRIESIDGNAIVTRRVLKPNGQVPAGSPWQPFAQLGVAQVVDEGGAGVYTDLNGGGNMYDGTTSTPWFVDFPGATLTMRENATIAPSASFWSVLAGAYYALIVNPPTATVQPGRIGMIKYTVPTGSNTLVIVDRLHATDATLKNATTVGDVVYGGAVINSANIATEYAKVAAIIPCNAKGTPIGACVGISGDAMGFVRGNYWGDLFKQKVEGGLSGEQVFSGWTFGEALYTLPNGDTPGVVVSACAIPYPAYSLPVIT